MSFLLTVFFFVWFLNMLGLTPLGVNVTGNIAVTFSLALLLGRPQIDQTPGYVEQVRPTQDGLPFRGRSCEGWFLLSPKKNPNRLC